MLRGSETMAYKSNYDKIEPTKMIRELNLLIKEARVSPELRNAMIELRAAIRAKNYPLAAELAVVKSYVVGMMNLDPKHGIDHFREDAEWNREHFDGEDVYRVLDVIQHELAFNLHQMPAGAMIISRSSSSGKPHIEQRQPTAIVAQEESPTLKYIAEEHAEIVHRSAMRE